MTARSGDQDHQSSERRSSLPVVHSYADAWRALGPETGGGDLKDVIGIIRRRKAIVLTTVCLLTGLAALISFQLTPKYTATSAVLIEPSQVRVINLQSVVEDQPIDLPTIETQLSLLESNSHARYVIEKLGLSSDPEFNPFLSPEGAEGTLLSAVTDWLPTQLFAAAGSADQPEQSDHLEGPDLSERLMAWLPEQWLEAIGWARPVQVDQLAQGAEVDNSGGDLDELELEAVVTRFLEELDVSQSGNSYILSISFSSTVPKKAAQIANAVAELYVERQLDEKTEATTRATRWLAERVDQLRDRVLKSEGAVGEYRATHGLIEHTTGPTLDAQQLALVSAELINARAELAQREAKLRQVHALRKRGQGYDSLAEVLSSPLIWRLREEEAALLRQEAEFSREYGENHPLMRQLAAEKQNLTGKLDKEIQSIVGNLENEVVLARSREQALSQALDETKSQSTVSSKAEVQLGELQREAEADRTLYATFLARLKETQEQQDLLQPGARFVSTAVTPIEPSFPKPKLMTAAGFTASLMLGVLLAFLVERLDSGLRTGRQLAQVLGLPSLGLVPSVRAIKRNQKPHRYLTEKPLSSYAEAIRAVQKTVQLSNVDRPPRVMMVTSSLPSEGKTTLAVSLAASAARSGLRAVVVDLDLRRPKVASEMGQPVGLDLTQFMTGEATLDEVIHIDELQDGLHFIPARWLTSSPVDLLESPKMVSLLSELRRRYDYVVLDTPPALGITDAKIIALFADAVLFAVRWDKTKAEIAFNGLEALAAPSIATVGLVLTQVDLRRHRKFQYHDVGHYYGKYGKYYQD